MVGRRPPGGNVRYSALASHSRTPVGCRRRNRSANGCLPSQSYDCGPRNVWYNLRIMTQNLDTLRHSAAHIMARAVMRLYPNVQLAFGPNVENGFYYDFSMEHRLTEEDFPKIEADQIVI